MRSVLHVNDAAPLEVYEGHLFETHWLGTFTNHMYSIHAIAFSEASDVEITLEGCSSYLPFVAHTVLAHLPAGISTLDTVKDLLRAQQRLSLPVHQELLGVPKWLHCSEKTFYIMSRYLSIWLKCMFIFYYYLFIFFFTADKIEGAVSCTERMIMANIQSLPAACTDCSSHCPPHRVHPGTHSA